MLAAESRDFGLAEIIDHVHHAGIQAHDDAVRSITIKLMKDGKVERVGRGRTASPAAVAGPSAGRGPGEQPAPEQAPEFAPDPQRRPRPRSTPSTDDLPARRRPGGRPDARRPELEAPAADAGPEATEAGRDSDAQGAGRPPAYTPPLNLGQPWR